MTNEMDPLSNDLISEYQALAGAIEKDHPGCLRRFDLWNQGGTFQHGFIGGRPCPAGTVHRKRRDVLARCVALVSVPASGLPSHS